MRGRRGEMREQKREVGKKMSKTRDHTTTKNIIEYNKIENKKSSFKLHHIYT